MLTNGCTYGAELHCGKHGEQEQVERYQKPGASQARRAAYTAVGVRGVWTRGANWRKVKVDLPPMTQALDKLAHSRVQYDGPGYLIRKGARP